MTAMIQLRSLSMNYGNFCALNDINLDIPSGVTGLLGPNGAGKSTLIKVLLGLIRVSSGNGKILGHPLGSMAKELRMQIGYMPEDDCFIHGLTGIESMQMAARLTSMGRIESLRRGHEILDFCGVRQERYRPVQTYSTGMRQKLRFALALVHDPKLLILDEPTTGLDPEEREAMLNRVRVLSHDFSISVLLCTHILPDVQAVCEHVLILSAGSVRIHGSMEDVCRVPSPQFQVHVATDGVGFERSLTELQVPVTGRKDNVLTISGFPAEYGDQIWQAANTPGQFVRSITPSANSLEKLFLEAVREGQHGNS